MTQRTTIRDVAARAGVSVSAVSYIMNNSTAKKYSDDTVSRVKEAADALGYRPTNIARGMRSQKSHTIGVVSFWDMSNRVFVQTLEGIMAESTDRGYAVIICPIALSPIGTAVPDDFSYIRYYTDKRVDGIILIAPPSLERSIHESAHIEALKSDGVPFVIINSMSGGTDFSAIRFDFRATTVLAVETLVRLGHEHIAYVHPAEIAEYEESKLRLEGYLSAVKSPQVLTLEEITPQMLGSLRAVVTNKSETAKHLLDMAIDAGIDVPGRLSVVAANVENYSEFLHPPLTCVQMPFGEMGHLAVEMLLAHIGGGRDFRQLTLPCGLIEGESVKVNVDASSYT